MSNRQQNVTIGRPNWYERNVLPYVIDVGCGIRPVQQQRRKVVPLARGNVLEIGFGTGRNFEFYDAAKVTKLTGLDPAKEMHALARKRLQKTSLSMELIGLTAEKIPMQAASFDSVVMTYTLCSIPDPMSALNEMRRVLKPNGCLIFCEHGLAPEPSVRRWQAKLTPLWSRLTGGCHLNRDIPALLRDAGFESQDLQRMYIPGPRVAAYNYWGTARVAREG